MKRRIRTAEFTRKAKEYSAYGVLCFLLLFVQSADLTHSHDGDLQQQFDCEICLKVGANEDFIESSGMLVNLDSDASNVTEYKTEAPNFFAISANSRAPPLV